MSDERKKAGVWPWIVALLIGLPVLYVLSSGPARTVACRRYSLNIANEWDMRIVADKWWLTVYAPLCCVSENSAQPCAKILNLYSWKFPIPKRDDFP